MYKIDGRPPIEALLSKFKDLRIIETENFHRLSEALTHNIINLDLELAKSPEKR